jgi:hypothetical protein
MDLHRIPDDLSIPEFLKRDRRRIRSDYEMDRMSGEAILEAFRELNEEERERGKHDDHRTR